MTRQKAATITTTINQGSVNTTQFCLTKANYMYLLVKNPAARLIKQLAARTVHGCSPVPCLSVNYKTKMVPLGYRILSDSHPHWIA